MSWNNIIRVAADGSPGSRRAYEWALSEGARRKSSVELLTVYTGASDRGEPIEHSEAEAAAESLTKATMQGVSGPADVPVSYRIVQGEPADVLVRESRACELLVMGSHGVEGLRHSALGSVADTCARMADCPVVIVPAGRAAHAGDELVAGARTQGSTAPTMGVGSE